MGLNICIDVLPKIDYNTLQNLKKINIHFISELWPFIRNESDMNKLADNINMDITS